MQSHPHDASRSYSYQRPHQTSLSPSHPLNYVDHNGHHGGYGAVQDTPQDRQHLNVADYRLADYRELRDDPAVPYIYPNIGLAQGALEHEQVISPDHQGNHRLGYAPQRIVPGPTQTTFPDPSAHQPHALGQPTVENLRRLASRYVHHPDSKVDMVRMEPGTAGRYKVVIVLEMSDFL